MQKKMLRKTTKTESAARIAALLEAVEYGLIRAVTKCDGLTVKAQGDLVSMQRRLRAMRYEVEAEARIGAQPPGVVLDFAPVSGTGAG
ncbi:hypothetical protein [Pararhodobacter aggregans]|uniref:Uncharacterized protein n=1 Tax=Pararhodobacter aggregans TaxID=404875 RepID=A0A2T7UQM4_9RHOB|nr:hypothetical protein [Pararhodobacter aggregans]PTX01824.1 hypothetical protein C8N33_10641 [Pararhodobacter aggregans]PVE47023.1 hypothetical protein DDE23_12235 [Pararhodobacter aggregans]